MIPLPLPWQHLWQFFLQCLGLCIDCGAEGAHEDLLLDSVSVLVEYPEDSCLWVSIL